MGTSREQHITSKQLQLRYSKQKKYLTKEGKYYFSDTKYGILVSRLYQIVA